MRSVPAAPAGLRCAGLGAWWPGDGGVPTQRERRALRGPPDRW